MIATLVSSEHYAYTLCAYVMVLKHACTSACQCSLEIFRTYMYAHATAKYAKRDALLLPFRPKCSSNMCPLQLMHGANRYSSSSNLTMKHFLAVEISKPIVSTCIIVWSCRWMLILDFFIFCVQEVEVTQQRLACENLEKDLSEERRKCTDLVSIGPSLWIMPALVYQHHMSPWKSFDKALLCKLP